MTSVGILEVNTHQNLLRTNIQTLISAGFDVTVFTTNDIRSDIVEENHITSQCDWNLIKNRESIADYLERVEDVCSNSIDNLFIQYISSEIDELKAYLRFNPDCNIACQLYNLNNWFSFPHVRLTVAPYISYLARRVILRKFDLILVEYGPMKEFLCENIGLGKKVKVWSPSIYNCEAEHNNIRSDNQITITIPGHIRDDRRDYRPILDIFKLMSDSLNKEIRLVLLGNPRGTYGKDIVDYAESLQNSGYNITYYERWVSTDEFNGQLLHTDFLIAPLKYKINKGGWYEIYGRTKGCGTVLDAIKTGTPAFVPSHFNIPTNMEGLLNNYSSTDRLENRLTSIITCEKTTKLKNEAKYISQNYTLPKQSKRLRSIISELESH
ncbi:hypothetical protein [Haloglomus halophilum]|uniref:hypothetical protein n=1 Tax=Haloglomus halophilum TaxID=2962672 RepID=UPI0020CA21DF|nr:hypothetical protein [Haloglomus halophilum]